MAAWAMGASSEALANATCPGFRRGYSTEALATSGAWRVNCEACSATRPAARMARSSLRTGAGAPAAECLLLRRRAPTQGLKLRAVTTERRCLAVRAAVAATEPATGIAFPPSLQPAGTSTSLSLLGTGVREKKIAFITVKVYAAALYADVASLSDGGLTDAWKGKSASQLEADPASLASLAQAAANKAIVITLAMDVKGEQFVQALSEELVPRLKAQGSDSSPVDRLGDIIKAKQLKKNTAVVLTWQQPSSLLVSFVDDVKSGYESQSNPATIESPPLLNALFDVYLGPKTVSISLVSSVAAGLASL